MTAPPTTIKNPALLAWNHQLANSLGLGLPNSDEDHLARIFAGSDVPDGAEPISMAYAGHQFGYLSPQLGDGRATLLGEVVTSAGDRFDVQLKGSGRTAFSRGGDGKSWLGPVIREYILSEAMHRLGVPTTRALAAVLTNETVYRESPLPGAVFTRVASSHLRIGTFEYFAARGDKESVSMLAAYAIDRHYPDSTEADEPIVEFFRRVSQSQAELVARWMAVGFVHGVMNTDNSTISGETIDYGPAAYLDEFNFRKVFSSIDRQGRYAYANQAPIAQWNLARLAESLLLVGDFKAEFEKILAEFADDYVTRYLDLMRPKLGLSNSESDDSQLISAWLDHLQEGELDYTLSFRELATRVDADDTSRFGEFETRWRQRLREQDINAAEATTLMNSVNPLYIARNHRVEQAINAAVDGDYAIFHDLNTVLSEPYAEQPKFAHFAAAPEQDERVKRTFCGT